MVDMKWGNGMSDIAAMAGLCWSSDMVGFQRNLVVAKYLYLSTRDSLIGELVLTYSPVGLWLFKAITCTYRSRNVVVFCQR